MRLLLDIEGTLYAAGQAVPGASGAVAELRSAGCGIHFLSNKDSLPGRAVAARLREMGFDVADGEVTTPVDALRRQLEAKAESCHLLVAPAVAAELNRWESVSPVDSVVVGDLGGELSWERLDRAFRHLRDGARLLALQRGRYFLADDGAHIDTGAFVRALEYAAGTEATLVGKPAPEFFRGALEQIETDGEVLVVGDDLSTDIAGAKAIGARSVLVGTGKQASAAGSGSARDLDDPPDRAIDSVADLPRLLETW